MAFTHSREPGLSRAGVGNFLSSDGHWQGAGWESYMPLIPKREQEVQNVPNTCLEFLAWAAVQGLRPLKAGGHRTLQDPTHVLIWGEGCSGFVYP